MKNYLLSVTFILFTITCFSQINSNFDKGFFAGFNETLRDSNINGNYNYLADPRKCDFQKTYVNDPKANEKIYGDGYRCGVKQANIAISKIENNNTKNLSNRNNLKFTNDIEQNKNIANHAINNLNLPPAQRAAKIAEINAQLQEVNNKLIVEKSINESRNKELNQKIENERNDIEYQNKSRIAQDNLNRLNQLRNEQIKSYNNYNQTITSTLNELNNSMQQAVYAQVSKELERRRQATNQFYELNSNRIENISSIYKSIPVENFNKTLNGIYKGNLLHEKIYSFSNGQKILTEIPVLVEVRDNQVINFYDYGKSGFTNDLPKKQPDNSYLNNGIVEYIDFENLEVTTIVISEPYLTNNFGGNNLSEKGTGFLIIWTSNKSDVGKEVYLQELNTKGEIVREVKTKLTYVKNKNELDKINIVKIPMNTGNKILFFGEPTNTIYGRIPLYLKVSKSEQKPLDENEIRPVKIKKYRE